MPTPTDGNRELLTVIAFSAPPTASGGSGKKLDAHLAAPHRVGVAAIDVLP